jgi:hypothetical protein
MLPDEELVGMGREGGGTCLAYVYVIVKTYDPK